MTGCAPAPVRKASKCKRGESVRATPKDAGICIMPRMAFLAIDIGNTRLKWSMFEHARPGAALLAHGAEFLDHIERLAEGLWAELPAATSMLGCVVAGDAVRRRAEEQVNE